MNSQNFETLVLDSSENEDELDQTIRNRMTAQQIQKVNNFEHEDKLVFLRSIERRFLKLTFADKLFFASLILISLTVAAFTLLNFIDLNNKRVEIVETVRLIYQVTQQSVYSIVCWNALTQTSMSSKMAYNSTAVDEFIKSCPSTLTNVAIAAQNVSLEDTGSSVGNQFHVSQHSGFDELPKSMSDDK